MLARTFVKKFNMLIHQTWKNCKFEALNRNGTRNKMNPNLLRLFRFNKLVQISNRKIFGKPKRSTIPYDKRFKLTPKSAGPAKRGGYEEWGQLPEVKYGTEETGMFINGKFYHDKNMEIEWIVPSQEDMKNCKLKPYVSYNVEEVWTEELSAKELYEKCLMNEDMNEFKTLKTKKKKNVMN
ncbi:hypothetical protein SNEBB_008236 [Seison nebaliae]|nr:hypothetical protein SNEBB_008236 [Seison nebaliae]